MFKNNIRQLNDFESTIINEYFISVPLSINNHLAYYHFENNNLLN